jgi:hypothetical protein
MGTGLLPKNSAVKGLNIWLIPQNPVVDALPEISAAYIAGPWN